MMRAAPAARPATTSAATTSDRFITDSLGCIQKLVNGRTGELVNYASGFRGASPIHQLPIHQSLEGVRPQASGYCCCVPRALIAWRSATFLSKSACSRYVRLTHAKLISSIEVGPLPTQVSGFGL